MPPFRIAALTASLFAVAVLGTSGSPPVCAGVVAPASSEFRVTGAVAQPMTWSVETVRAHFSSRLRTVSYSLKGTLGRATCLSLITLIEAARPRFDRLIKNHSLSFAILVVGRDGYSACFSLSELSPTGGNNAVWIALDQNGHKLSGKASPAGLVVPGDTKPGRWVHGIGRIEVIDLRQVMHH